MTDTARWNLPLLTAGQAQKEIAHNEALQAIDRVLHLAVVTRSLSHPPGDATLGETFIIGPGPSGGWSSSAGMIASYDGFGWVLTPARTGCLAWICDEAVLTVYNGDSWQTLRSLA